MGSHNKGSHDMGSGRNNRREVLLLSEAWQGLARDRGVCYYIYRTISTHVESSQRLDEHIPEDVLGCTDNVALVGPALLPVEAALSVGAFFPSTFPLVFTAGGGMAMNAK